MRQPNLTQCAKPSRKVPNDRTAKAIRCPNPRGNHQKTKHGARPATTLMGYNTPDPWGEKLRTACELAGYSNQLISNILTLYRGNLSVYQSLTPLKLAENVLPAFLQGVARQCKEQSQTLR